MRVTIDGDWDDDQSLGVYLDDGTEVGRYCIVDNPEQERTLLEMMLLAVIAEAKARMDSV